MTSHDSQWVHPGCGAFSVSLSVRPGKVWSSFLGAGPECGEVGVCVSWSARSGVCAWTYNVCRGMGHDPAMTLSPNGPLIPWEATATSQPYFCLCLSLLLSHT